MQNTGVPPTTSGPTQEDLIKARAWLYRAVAFVLMLVGAPPAAPAALPAGTWDPANDAACVQMLIRLAGAVADGYAEEVGEPDEDGNRLLHITPAGIARLDHYRGAS